MLSDIMAWHLDDYLNITYCKYIVWLAERSDRRDSEYIFIFCRYVLVNIFMKRQFNLQ